MKIKTSYSIIISIGFLWIGFVCAISFMESWLKFSAPGITMTLGLGIGKLVFHALNKVEWLFALIMIVCLLTSKHLMMNIISKIFLAPFCILLLQTFYLLPELDERSLLLIEEKQVAPSYLHLFYIIAEVVKVICLILLGTITLKYNQYVTGQINA